MQWPRLLAYITGRVDKELLVRNEYLAAENRVLRAKIKGRLQLADGEKRTLAEIAHRLGRKALADVAVAAKPDTILRWFRKLVARKFDGSACRESVGRPRVEKTIEDLIVRMAQENPSWGYDRMVGALANLGHSVSDQTVGNVLKRQGIAPSACLRTSTRLARSNRWRSSLDSRQD
jgi:putative transposase